MARSFGNCHKLPQSVVAVLLVQSPLMEAIAKGKHGHLASKQLGNEADSGFGTEQCARARTHTAHAG
eukprot:5290986-Amphidinium_carterae.1